MQEIVTFDSHEFRLSKEPVLCTLFHFSVVDSSVDEAMRKVKTSHHVIKGEITLDLAAAWRFFPTTHEQLAKLLFYYAKKRVRQMIASGELQEANEFVLTTDDASEGPPDLNYVPDPDGHKFTVDIDDQVIQSDGLTVHPNIRILMGRMDDALGKGDYSGVIHASASIFETLAKEVVGIPTVQSQTLKSFFQRYRQDSLLPNEILDYMLDIYESRSTTPLAGHGSTQTPNISREEAVTLSEMTKAFVRVEYKLREKKP